MGWPPARSTHTLPPVHPFLCCIPHCEGQQKLVALLKRRSARLSRVRGAAAHGPDGLAGPGGCLVGASWFAGRVQSQGPSVPATHKRQADSRPGLSGQERAYAGRGRGMAHPWQVGSDAKSWAVQVLLPAQLHWEHPRKASWLVVQLQDPEGGQVHRGRGRVGVERRGVPAACWTCASASVAQGKQAKRARAGTLRCAKLSVFILHRPVFVDDSPHRVASWYQNAVSKPPSAAPNMQQAATWNASSAAAGGKAGRGEPGKSCYTALAGAVRRPSCTGWVSPASMHCLRRLQPTHPDG